MTAAGPWYRRTLRWAQTNLTEIDPERYDDAWWRRHWRQTAIQGVIVNAGGIVAYYPSKFGLHHRALALGDRDLYGEIVASARDEGLTVVARMDSNRVAEDFYQAYPQWICRDVNGEPITVADKWVTCINSPYYSEYLPGVLREIIERSHPDGFADNSWAGLPRSSICYCSYCSELFGSATGLELPRDHDWDTAEYRAWISWSYQRRTQLWELNNRVTTEAGGPDCLWFGMISGDVLSNSNRSIDLRQIVSRSELIMLDHQHRNPVDGFEQNTEAGKRLHGLLGWEKLIPESTPQYQLGAPAFRVAAMPAAEVRLWATAGFAGGIQPWWHHIGSRHDDRRQYQTAAALFGWHRDNADVLTDRTPIADVAIVWSQQNNDFAGRDSAAERTLNPYQGMARAATAAGIGYQPLHTDDLTSAIDRFAVIVLPDIEVLSDDHVTAITSFVEHGGSLIISGTAGLQDSDGTERSTSPLADLFGVHPTGESVGARSLADRNIETHQRHSYLRLTPELRAGVDGPTDTTAPAPNGTRHPVLAGLDDTDLIPFGGYLPIAQVDDAEVLATLVPDFPIYPPETSWMREPRTDIPAIIANQLPSGGRLVWLLADLDRCYARDEQPDHATILGNALRWAIGDQLSFSIAADGLVSASLYRQPNRTILHLTNRVVTTRIPGRETHLVPVGPVRVQVRVDGSSQPRISSRVTGKSFAAKAENGYLTFEIDKISDHDVIVIDDSVGR